ncbi:MAG: hypothetical protein ACK4YF_02125 [Exilispira sp.]
MLKNLDYDKIIAKIMENESIAKNLSDDEYQKIIIFLKETLFDFLIFFYLKDQVKNKLKKIRTNYFYNLIEEKIINFSCELIRKFHHNNVDIELNILEDALKLLKSTFYD